MAMGMWMVAA